LCSRGSRKEEGVMGKGPELPLHLVVFVGFLREVQQKKSSSWRKVGAALGF